MRVKDLHLTKRPGQSAKDYYYHKRTIWYIEQTFNKINSISYEELNKRIVERYSNYEHKQTPYTYQEKSPFTQCYNSSSNNMQSNA